MVVAAVSLLCDWGCNRCTAVVDFAHWVPARLKSRCRVVATETKWAHGRPVHALTGPYLTGPCRVAPVQVGGPGSDSVHALQQRLDFLRREEEAIRAELARAEEAARAGGE